MSNTRDLTDAGCLRCGAEDAPHGARIKGQNTYQAGPLPSCEVVYCDKCAPIAIRNWEQPHVPS